MSKVFDQFHPKHFLAALSAIDRESIIPLRKVAPQYRVLVTMLFIGGCLLLVHYGKYSSFFYGLLGVVLEWQDVSLRSFAASMRSHTFGDLYIHAWWGFVHLVGYFLLPALFIRFYLKESLAQHGLQSGEVSKHLKWYFFLAAPIIGFAIIVSFGKDFSHHYPFYKLASRSWVDLLLWESIYIVQFIVLEFFFRGFFLNSLKPVFGSNAILVMCLPYLMIHFPKLWLEAAGALFFGLFLGVLALQSRSIWGGVCVHVSIALVMDIAALMQTRGLPEQFFP